MPVRPGGDVDDDGGVLHGDDEEDVLVARVELHLEHGGRESESLVAVARQQIPERDVVVGRGGDQLASGARPGQRADRVHVGLDDFRDSPVMKCALLIECFGITRRIVE